MAATDVFYRDQKKVNIVFAASCVLMLASTIWMVADDFNRPYKKDQKVYRDVEEEMAKRAALALAPDPDKQKEIVASEAAVVNARKLVEQLKPKVNDAIKAELPKKARMETELQNTKADYDSRISYYNIAVEAKDPDAERFLKEANDKLPIMAKIRGELEQLNEELAKMRKKDFEVAAGTSSLDGAEANLKALEKSHKELTGDFDRFIKLSAQKRWGLADTFRGLPVIDGFAPPVKIKQTFHEDLPIDYGGFKYVTRYDRCTTCHLGIDKANMDKSVVQRLTLDPMKDESLRKQYENAKLVLEERQKTNKDRKQDLNALSPTALEPQRLPLTAGQVSMFSAHPKLDMYVDATSKHPAEKFGCSICHQGQGSATGFVDAVHTPNQISQREEWTKEHGWRHIHDWEFPMFPPRFIEATCIKCHHQVESLVTESVKVEAPKVLKGYNLVRELGCFGCHEISGVKAGRWVGPDLRLESDPPLDAMTPAERAKQLSDPNNPPGMQRKVGPSLQRIADKNSPEWTAKWMKAPRVFRPDTKMPHFYMQANNVPEVLPEDQKKFADAEVQAITKYLFEKSKAHITESHINLPTPPALPGDDAGKKAQTERGRHLFATKGCMACHKHAGMETAGEAAADGKPQPTLVGDSNFGPELSRIAAKFDPQKGRSWLVQWLLDPTIHSPRTLMPNTHLTNAEAGDVAAWLLAQAPKADPEWDNLTVEKPESATLKAMAKMYLRKAGLTTKQLKDVIDDEHGFSAEELVHRAADADERELAAPATDDKLMVYIGKKAISNLGCYGCHNIPGFKDAKPIGVALNDWGKKDPNRIAYEDSANYVADRYHQIKSWNPSEEEKEIKAEEDKHDHGGKNLLPLERYAPYDTSIQSPYEEYFAEMLHHGHQLREGFLHLKLMSPRSYDYKRVRDWNDRARMPQFKFARTKMKEGEKPEEYRARADHEEAEAREAVMTFILGLIAEPIPPKFVYQPTGDRAAEIKGYKVIEKFNCSSCHIFRPGQFDIKLDPNKKFVHPVENTEVTAQQMLVMAHQGYLAGEAGDPKDRIFPNHVAWVGKPPPPGSDKVPVRGFINAIPAGDKDVLLVRPAEAVAFRYTDEATKKEMIGNIPANAAGAFIFAEPGIVTQNAEPLGGRFALLLKRYLTEWDSKVYGDVQPLHGLADETGQGPNGYAALPPTLLYEGERVQPEWLYQFLLDPKPIRKIPVLQMPKFSLSEDDAMALVNYFTAVNRMQNPAIGLTGPYDRIVQRDDAYLLAKTKEYVGRLKANNLYDERVKELKPVWTLAAKEAQAAAERRLQGFKDIKDEGKTKEAQAEIDSLKAQIDKGDFPAYKARWEEREAYVADAWKLVTYSGNLCITCHQVGPALPNEYRAPNLHQTFERLRPEWTERWISYPQRLTPYASLMQPQYKPSEAKKHSDEYKAFIGTPADQIAASRDLLIMFPQVQDWAVIKYRVGPTAFGPPIAQPPK